MKVVENLYRAEQIGHWVELSNRQTSQLATNESKRTDGKGHRPESGVNRAARDLNIKKDEAHRAVKVSKLTPEAKEAARAVVLTHCQDFQITPNVRKVWGRS